MQNEAERERLFNQVNPISRSDIDLEGANVSRETYADLFAVIGTTFGSGDGSTTFNLPDLRDRYIIGANTNALGTQIAEQLPNITGKSAPLFMFSGSPSGAFYAEEGETQRNDGTNNIRHRYLGFNANRSNPIYTDNGHVYPLSLALLPCIKY